MTTEDVVREASLDRVGQGRPAPGAFAPASRNPTKSKEWSLRFILRFETVRQYASPSYSYLRAVVRKIR
jgi:hypothetical protein